MLIVRFVYLKEMVESRSMSPSIQPASMHCIFGIPRAGVKLIGPPSCIFTWLLCSRNACTCAWQVPALFCPVTSQSLLLAARSMELLNVHAPLCRDPQPPHCLKAGGSSSSLLVQAVPHQSKRHLLGLMRSQSTRKSQVLQGKAE